MKIEETTKIRNQGNSSLVTTIPKTYVKILKLNPEDTLEWVFDTKTGKLEIDINKKKIEQ